ncbi:unnamed protein product, partial [Prorocentrum cordatum]
MARLAGVSVIGLGVNRKVFAKLREHYGVHIVSAQDARRALDRFHAFDRSAAAPSRVGAHFDLSWRQVRAVKYELGQHRANCSARGTGHIRVWGPTKRASMAAGVFAQSSDLPASRGSRAWNPGELPADLPLGDLIVSAGAHLRRCSYQKAERIKARRTRTRANDGGRALIRWVNAADKSSAIYLREPRTGPLPRRRARGRQNVSERASATMTMPLSVATAMPLGGAATMPPLNAPTVPPGGTSAMPLGGATTRPPSSATAMPLGGASTMPAGGAPGQTAEFMEIMSFAQSFGIDTSREQDLLWFAEEALRAQLPPGWSEHVDQRGRTYFHFAGRNESVWRHPMEKLFRDVIGYWRHVKARGGFWDVEDELVRLEESVRQEMSNWVELSDWQGERFFFNKSSQESRLDNPRDLTHHDLYTRTVMVAKMRPATRALFNGTVGQ